MPLAILAAWEEHIVSPACTGVVGLLLGALLLCAHCSLRFGDIQRIKPSALSLSAQALRGLCWATKTTSQGQPFASLSRPMSYLQALVCLRWAIQLPWKSEGGQLVTQHEASSFTLHSLKCALLSAAAQLRLPEDSRSSGTPSPLVRTAVQQGRHHRRLNRLQGPAPAGKARDLVSMLAPLAVRTQLPKSPRWL